MDRGGDRGGVVAVVVVGAPRLRQVGQVEAGVAGAGAGAVVKGCRVAAAVVTKSAKGIPPDHSGGISLSPDLDSQAYPADHAKLREVMSQSYGPAAGWFLRA